MTESQKKRLKPLLKKLVMEVKQELKENTFMIKSPTSPTITISREGKFSILTQPSGEAGANNTIRIDANQLSQLSGITGS